VSLLAWLPRRSKWRYYLMVGVIATIGRMRCAGDTASLAS